MNTKLKAALDTVLFFIVAIVCGIAVGIISEYIGPKAVLYILGAIFFGVFGYIIYHIRLAKLLFDQHKK